MITIDFETYSEAGYNFDKEKNRWTGVLSGRSGISIVGAYKYATHESTRILCLAYDIENDIRLWIPGMEEPRELLYLVADQKYIEAHNAIFEYYIWNFCLRKYLPHWPKLHASQLICSAAKARINGLPSALSKIPEALGTKEIKDTQGERLIKLLSCPRNPTKKDERIDRRLPEDFSEDFSKMYLYCVQDVRTEKDISERLPDMSYNEKKLWEIDLDINCQGVTIDRNALEGCIREFEKTEQKLTEKLKLLTDNTVNSVNEIKKITDWLNTQGLVIKSLNAESIRDLLDRNDLSEKVREVLTIRQTLSSASVKKLYIMRERLDENNKIHDLYMFRGAERTGRFAGRGPQPQNLPRESSLQVGLDIETSLYTDNVDAEGIQKTDWNHDIVKQILFLLSTQSSLAHWKNPVSAISGSLRGLFIASPGYDFISSDYSAIEARVLAELAGEDWRQQVFRGHGKIYEMSGSKITGVPFEAVTKNHPARRLGKVAELASGYGGWVGAWKMFGADKFMNEEEIKNAVLKWREASPAIVEFWGGQWRKDPEKWEFHPERFGIEGMAVNAILSPGDTFKYRRIFFQVRNNVLYCRLPSERELVFREPKLVTITDTYSGHPVHQISFMGLDTTGKWTRIATRGGSLTGIITQATACDIFTAAMLRIHRLDPYRIVLHTHDEITTEVPEGKGSIEELESLMCLKEHWFKDWPIVAAGGWRGKRYRK